MSDHTETPAPLSTLDVNLLVKVAATVYDEELLDLDATDCRVVNLLRRCSDVLASGYVVQVGVPLDALARGLASSGSTPVDRGASGCRHGEDSDHE